jgi:hypothetical protein
MHTNAHRNDNRDEIRNARLLNSRHCDRCEANGGENRGRPNSKGKGRK